MKVLALIPARGGSKGVPRKNLRAVGGKPLIAWSIAAALAARRVSRVVVSTDDAEIAGEALRCGAEVPYMREARLADDRTPTLEVALDALDRCPGCDWLVLLQPTSPLRSAEDIDAAIGLCERLGAPSCVSVCAARESPYWMFTLGEDERLAPLFPGARSTRRQDLPPVYSLNGAIYVVRCDWLAARRSFIGAETVAYRMPIERSVDLDTELDFLQLRSLLELPDDVPLSPTP